MADAQNYKNHRKFVPLFHYVLFPILAGNFVFMGYHLYRDPSMSTAWSTVMAFAFIVTALFARVFALKAQDRLIRLEERLRMARVLSADLQPRINDFTIEQLIGLRFASDAELPELAATVLRDNISDREVIKKMVKSWRADPAQV